jgi:hypothetical protein
MTIGLQLFWLFVLAIPVACIAWTVVHEEIFREPRRLFVLRSRKGRTRLERKFFYMFTCDYCFSHWVSLFFVLLTDFRLLLDDWRGLVIALFAVVWVANQYTSIFTRLRLDVKREKAEIAATEQEIRKANGKKSQSESRPARRRPD